MEIHDPLEDEDAIQEMSKYKYHREEPNIILEDSDGEVEKGDDMTRGNDIDEEYVIVDKPSKNEYYE